MIRKAFVMEVNRDQHEEYFRRHNPIWPELAAVLKAHGAHNYSIFLHPATSQLFAYVEIEDLGAWQQIARSEVCQRWWAFMREIMPSNQDNSPASVELRSVFHLP